MSVLPPVARGRLVLALVAMFVGGALIALQSRINGELGTRLGDGFLAAFISFGSGLVLLSVGLMVWRPGRRGLARVARALRTREIPWWMVVGGVAGASFVLAQGLTIGILGVALFTVGIVCGQTVSSLVVDHIGIAGMPSRRASARRIAGAALAVVAVLVAVGDRLTADESVILLAAPVAAGAFVGWQGAVNGRIRLVAGSALTATFVNFLPGTVVLGLALLIHTAVAGWHPEFPSEPWLYFGGALGCIFIAAQAVIVRITGVLLMGLALLTGQLAASIASDLLVPVDGVTLRVTTVAGTLLLAVAVVIVALPPRRAVTASSGSPSP